MMMTHTLKSITESNINEHCVVMTGYDKEEGTVSLNDPLYGQITRDIDIFEEVYDDIGRFSLTVVRKND